MDARFSVGRGRECSPMPSMTSMGRTTEDSAEQVIRARPFDTDSAGLPNNGRSRNGAVGVGLSVLTSRVESDPMRCVTSWTASPLILEATERCTQLTIRCLKCAASADSYNDECVCRCFVDAAASSSSPQAAQASGGGRRGGGGCDVARLIVHLFHLAVSIAVVRVLRCCSFSLLPLLLCCPAGVGSSASFLCVLQGCVVARGAGGRP